MSSKYKCIFCISSFSRKSIYDKHILICELLHNSKRRIDNDNDDNDDDNDDNDDTSVPNIRNLYHIIMELILKNKKIEKKLEELSKVNTLVEKRQVLKKKIDIIQWLNSSYTFSEPFEKWIENINVERKHLEIVFKNNLVFGFISLFKDFIPIEFNNATNIPIRSVQSKKNVLFVFKYDESKQKHSWIELSKQMFYTIMNKIYKQMYQEFVLWQNENTHLFYDNDFTIKNATNIIKINGGKNTKDQSLFNETYKQLYNLFITNIQ